MNDVYEGSLLEDIAFLGDTLGPIFYYDPSNETARQLYGALSQIDVASAAAEWPFVADDAANCALALIKEGLTGEGGTLAADAAAGEDAAGALIPGAPETGATDASDDLIWEYRRLFVGPGIKPAPPWGSVYTDRECVVFGESTLALRRWMREVGIERLGDDEEPEDHIGLMLMLMAWIARNRPQELRVFLTEHLLTWSSHYLNQLEDATGHPFFKGLAALTRASLEGVQEKLEINVEYPRFYR